jgi:nitrogen fixation/metabolism regulation signal transduction histidine kinase
MVISRTLRYGSLGALALGGVLLFLLASASSNTRLFERHYPLLLAINGAIAIALLLLVIALVVRLVRRWRQGRFGARLMARFAFAFAMLGVLPGALIYVVSVQFLSRSIDSWFDVRVDKALESGLSLGRAALEAQLTDVTAKARVMALELAETPDVAQLQVLDRLRERAGVQEALLVTASGRLVGTTAAQGAELVPDLPSSASLRQARTQRVFAAIEGDPLATDARSGLRTRVIVPIPMTEVGLGGSEPVKGADGKWRMSEPAARFAPGRGEERLLQLTQRVPPLIAANAEALQSGYRDYQELSLARSGLRRIYTVTLTLTLLLAVFAAVASAVLLASSMTAPLLQVAEGTRAVAEGNYKRVREFRGNDELNVLTQSFNAMTRQLAEARDSVEAKQRELENARAYLERVLANLSAGVIVLDRDMRLATANHGASRILGTSLAPHIGKTLAELAPALAEQIADGFSDQALAATPKDSWQRQLAVPRAGAAPGAEPLALLARGSRLPLEDGPGYVVVFDDITQIISAQRAVAWGEVARRLAHEIKNPLTPIQLAAERLQMKLAGALPGEQSDALVRGTTTIVNQVAAMKRMVDDFRDYARVPPAQLLPLDLNALIEEVGTLYGVERGNTGRAASGVVIELQLDRRAPRIFGDATQLRQVVHNLLANAQDAILGSARATEGRIVVHTEAVYGDSGKGAARALRLAVEDNGPGFAGNILRRAFEPYVTTKPSGTGLGLAMVKKIIDEHDARIDLVNRQGDNGNGAQGATVTIVFRRLMTDEAEAVATPHSAAA